MLVDVRAHDDSITRTCQVIPSESRLILDKFSPAHEIYWSRSFKLTKAFRRNHLLHRVPDWAFSHITSLQVRSRALTCALHRRGDKCLGHMSWTRWNKMRIHNLGSESHCLVAATTDSEPEVYLTELILSEFEDLRERNILPQMPSDETPATLNAKDLQDMLMLEFCDDLLLPMGAAGEATMHGASEGLGIKK